MKMNANLRRRWTDDELKILKDLYPTTKAKDIGSIINRSSTSVNVKANNIGLNKPEDFHRNNNFEIILDGSLQSMYWIGFLLSDGHFHKKGNTVRLDQSVSNLNIIEEYKRYIKAGSKICITKKDSATKEDICHLTCVHKDAVTELCNLYDIRSTKTVNPPDFNKYNLSDEQWIALFIGYIDGDGCVRSIKNEYRIKITFEVHQSWLANLQFLKEKVYRYFNLNHKMTNVTINPNLKTTVMTSIASPTIVNGLYQFIKDNNLFHMERKWNKIDEIG